MRVSVKWLCDYVDVSLTVPELVERLTMVGLEVEGVEELNGALEHVITARVSAVRPHPGAQRLQLCEVTAGARSYQVACGATNVAAGSLVPLALPGASLPGGGVVRETMIRGERSEGMLCSQKELALGDDAGGVWLLPDHLPLGVALADALDIRDTILDVSITPNRADCLSVLGIAREVAAICGRQLNYPQISLEESGPACATLSSVTLEDPWGCPRYAARIIAGITIGPSPGWLRARLESVGLRSINNVVDVTNYVLMEMGQPLHAFDFDRLAENRIVVRRATDGERFVTLDGLERTMAGDTLMICDGRVPVAIAGVMGGLDSEITPATTRVFIESAYFQPQSIRRTSKQLGLRTESSYRFERGVDPEGVIRALDRAAQLMVASGGGRLAAGRLDAYPQPLRSPRLALRVARTNRFLGTSLTAAEMAAILRSIEMEVAVAGEDLLEVVPPSFRRDVAREVDLGEEIARLAGYNTIPTSYPQAAVLAAAPDDHQRAREQVRGALVGYGFLEVINYSFTSAASLARLGMAPGDRRSAPLRLQNPLSEEQAVLRTSLLPGLLENARRNFDHRNVNLRLFELSKVFLPCDEELPEERTQLAGILTGMRCPQLVYGGAEEVDFCDAKGTVEALLRYFCLESAAFLREPLEPYVDPGATAAVVCEGRCLGWVGRVHPQVAAAFDLKGSVWGFELDFDRLFEVRRRAPRYQPLPRFPSVVRDLALVLDEAVPVQAPLEFIRRDPPPLLEQAEVFDLYRDSQLGVGRRSVGYRLVYRSRERNLTDQEVNEVHEALVARVLHSFQARLR
jgi:phenylalanyl-tRNA synthetase beta chain